MTMTKDVFKSRGSTLEDEFFRRVDDELAQRLRDQWQHDRDVESLRKESQIQDQRVLEELLYAGVSPGTLQAMTLVPAIHVAWANGFVETQERAAVMQAAQHVGIHNDSTTGQLLMSWLDDKPTAELFQVWEDYVAALRDVVDVTSYRHLHDHAVRTAEDIAKAAGGILGVLAVSVAEQRAIGQIDRAFTR